jgi:hypothetical protein
MLTQLHRKARDFQALESRRKQAARLFARGTVRLASVARQLKVKRQSVLGEDDELAILRLDFRSEVESALAALFAEAKAS